MESVKFEVWVMPWQRAADICSSQFEYEEVDEFWDDVISLIVEYLRHEIG